MNSEQLTSCPICGGRDLKNYLICKDYSISGEEFQLQECQNCTVKFTNPRPVENEIGRYYQSEEYISHSNTSKGLINKLYHQVRKITLKKKLGLINGIAMKSSLLDIGCGTGYFLKTCLEDGWKIAGSEPDPSARKIAQEQTGIRIHSSIFEIEHTPAFEVITLWHVLEHIHKLNESLQKIHSLLRDKGKVVIAVPNPESWDARHYKNFWAAYDVPRHLYHFTQKSIEELLKRHHFRLTETHPMKFDSFYVSMMSEKYLTDKKSTNMIKSFINGCKSNIYANINNKNYSSIIYIAEKL